MFERGPVLFIEPREGHRRDLEGGLHHDQAAFVTEASGPGGL